MYECMYVCMHACMYVCTYVCISLLIFAVHSIPLYMTFISLACVKPVLMQPTNKNLTDLSFTIEWSLVTTGLLQNYTLSYRSVSSVKRQVEEPFLKIIIPAESTSYTVKNLTPYSSYCFLLQANYAQEDVVFSQKQSDEICDINTPPIGKLVIKISPSFPWIVLCRFLHNSSIYLSICFFSIICSCEFDC